MALGKAVDEKARYGLVLLFPAVVFYHWSKTDPSRLGMVKHSIAEKANKKHVYETCFLLKIWEKTVGLCENDRIWLKLSEAAPNPVGAANSKKIGVLS